MYSKLSTLFDSPVYRDFLEFEGDFLPLSESSTLENTLKSSARSTSIGLAFAAGYRSALQALLPSLDVGQWAAFCVSEEKGNHPRNIATQLNEQHELSGHKSFVTFADKAAQYIVIAKMQEGSEHPILKAVLVDAKTEGVSTQLMPDLPMIPEIPHGQLHLDGAKGKVLIGDGYLEYSKRFRTLEDLHVLCGFCTLILSVSYRHDLSTQLIERALQLLSSLPWGDLPEESAWYHLQLSSQFQLFRALVDAFEAEFEHLPNDFVKNWLRDKTLFGIANKARQVRYQKALNALNLSK